MTLSWVIGRGGFLGRHVESSLQQSAAPAAIQVSTASVRWEDERGALADLDREAAAFVDAAAASDRPWRLFWCAGAGVIATAPDTLARETALLGEFLDALGRRLARDRRLARAGTVFFASSAGGVYAASTAPPPFDEQSPVAALAPYGREKLIQEDLFRCFADELETDLVIGRLSNLYGPGQKLTKPQGLIAHVGRAALRREPVSIYVPLDTIRDYLFVTDAARMVTAAVEHCEAARLGGAPARITTKIFASEVESTVASVLAAWRRALRRPLRVAHAASPVGQLQPRVLSFRSRMWPDLLGRPTLLPLGVDAVRRDQLARLLSTGVG